MLNSKKADSSKSDDFELTPEWSPVLEKYQVLKVKGEGSFGTIVKAVSKLTG